MQIVADSLMGKMEQQYPPVAMSEIPASECLILLGGAVEPVFDYLPDAGALKMTTDALHEWMGQKVYQWRGWN